MAGHDISSIETEDRTVVYVIRVLSTHCHHRHKSQQIQQQHHFNSHHHHHHLFTARLPIRLQACRVASNKIVRLLSLALGLGAHGLDELVVGSSPHWQAKLAFYPGVSDGAEIMGRSSVRSAVGQGVGAHTDSGLLTMVLHSLSFLQPHRRKHHPPRSTVLSYHH